eukprot:TRINITY_DN82436_c0_g1_i1.p1 TRINITY_DN82436_c0_g1~~TRINITY_DN82436_c0_g1_i1.p1  ORF type:complete len:962 (-),score=160.30 TRINITY_DN82436_c0_g1_i1:91-2976(-)
MNNFFGALGGPKPKRKSMANRQSAATRQQPDPVESVKTFFLKEWSREVEESDGRHGNVQMLKDRLAAGAVKLQLTGIAIGFYVDRFLDLCKCYAWWSTFQVGWAMVSLIILAMPSVLLAAAHLHRGNAMTAYAALFSLTYFMAYRESMDAESTSRSLQTEMFMYAMFCTMPQYYFQAYVNMHNHFMASQCETAFDEHCVRTCGTVPLDMGNMTRFTCLEMTSEQRNTSLNCWTEYNMCIALCPGARLFRKRKGARERMLLATEGAQATRAVALHKLVSELEVHIQEDLQASSRAWRDLGCRAESTAFGELTSNEEYLESVWDEKVRYSIGKTNTMKVQISSWSTIPEVLSTISGLAMTGAALMQNTIAERYPLGTSLTLATPLWRRMTVSYFIHYASDMYAGVLSFSWLFSCLTDGERLLVTLGVTLLLQLVFHFRSETGLWKPFHRMVWGFVVVPLSPVVTLPSMPDMAGKLARHVLILRFLLREVALAVGFSRVSKVAAYSRSEWMEQFIFCQAILLVSILSTRLTGPAAVWSYEHDAINYAKYKISMQQQAEAVMQGEYEDSLTFLGLFEIDNAKSPVEHLCRFLVDNDFAQSQRTGVHAYASTDESATPQATFVWGTVLDGHDMLNDWVKLVSDDPEIHGLYVAKALNGNPVLTILERSPIPEDATPLKVAICGGLDLQRPGCDQHYMDVYVICVVLRKPHLTFRTHCERGGKDPVWSHSHELMGRTDEEDTLELLVFDRDDFSKDDFIGKVEVPPDKIRENFQGKLPLDTAGQLDIKIMAPRPPTVRDEFLVMNETWQSVEDGLHYHELPHNASRLETYATWAEPVFGYEHPHGWLFVEGEGYLPMFRDGHVVLKRQRAEHVYFVDDSLLQDATEGLGYRRSRVLTDIHPDKFAKWGMRVRGVAAGDGWIRVGNLFLPTELDGTPVLVEFHTESASELARQEHLDQIAREQTSPAT